MFKKSSGLSLFLAAIFACSASAQEFAAPDILVKEIFEKCNSERKRLGIQPLILDSPICRVARLHSKEMTQLRYFGHNSPNPENEHLSHRYKNERIYCLSIAENLSLTEGYSREEIAGRVVEDWLSSPDHRKNLLNPRFNRVGIGYAQQGEKFIFTQDFAYIPIKILKTSLVSTGSGSRLTLKCAVFDGPKRGALFFEGKKVINWTADADGEFHLAVELPAEGLVSLGQKTAQGDFSIESEIPVQDLASPMP